MTYMTKRSDKKRKSMVSLLLVTLIVMMAITGIPALAQRTFTPRFTAPCPNDYFYSEGNIYWQHGWPMPNCAAYAWGRLYEINGHPPAVTPANANRWFGSGGYETGWVPALGATMAWNSGPMGHVAIVEQINEDGTVIISESHSSGEFWTLQTVPQSGEHIPNFQGYIYTSGPPGTFAMPPPPVQVLPLPPPVESPPPIDEHFPSDDYDYWDWDWEYSNCYLSDQEDTLIEYDDLCAEIEEELKVISVGEVNEMIQKLGTNLASILPEPEVTSCIEDNESNINDSAVLSNMPIIRDPTVRTYLVLPVKSETSGDERDVTISSAVVRTIISGATKIPINTIFFDTLFYDNF